MSDKISSLDQLTWNDGIKIVYKMKRSIFINVFIVFIFSVLISLIMPKTFRATAVLMPPSSSPRIGLLSAFTDLPFGNILSQPGDASLSLIAILKSRTVIESVVNRFNLVSFYKAEDIEEAIDELTDNTQFIIENEGTIRISSFVSTGWLHPENDEKLAKNLSADIVTYFIERLDSVNTGLKSKQATFQRAFIEQRYNKNIRDLHNAEEKLKIFQENHKLIALPEQTNAAIEVAASIKTKIMLNEVELNLLKSTLNSGHPEINQMMNEIEELKKKLNELENGNNVLDITIDAGLFPVFTDVPDLGLKLLRYTREVEIQNTLFTFLTQKYEEAKIEEAKDTPTIQVLDNAKIPIKWHSPRRALIVVSSFLFMLFINVIIVIVKENNYNITS